MTQAAAPLRTTPLNATHRSLKAKMVDFGGWDMPVLYSSLLEEHHAVHTRLGADLRYSMVVGDTHWDDATTGEGDLQSAAEGAAFQPHRAGS